MQLRVRLWRRGSDGKVKGEPVVDCYSRTAAVETGGVGWDGTWKAGAAMKQPLRAVLQAPINPDAIFSRVPAVFRPNGL